VIYRREASGPDDPGDPDPSHSELLATGEEFLGAGPHQHLDAAVDAGVWYAYLVVGIDTDGSVAYSAPLVALAPDLVARLELARPAPHPFRPGRSLRYAVPAPGGRVELAIFDVAGRRVRQLVDGPVSPGRYTVTWDGRDTRGSRLPSGIYFARLSHRRDVRTARIVMLW
jgi:hypothetical protein